MTMLKQNSVSKWWEDMFWLVVGSVMARFCERDDDIDHGRRQELIRMCMELRDLERCLTFGMGGDDDEECSRVWQSGRDEVYHSTKSIQRLSECSA